MAKRTLTITRTEARQRGEPMSSPLAAVVGATVHPSSILRAPDDETRREEMRRFIEDLQRIVFTESPR